MDRLNFQCQELKAIGESGSFSGYASVFGNIDLGFDVIERGAFKEIMKGRNGKVKVLNQHRMSDPIGVADVEQDDKGLRFDGQLILESASARGAHALMKGGALDGMSIGFDVLEGGAEVMNSGVRKLTALKLWEISPVTFGMNPLAGIDGVKGISTIRAFEELLRDVAGFSHREAKAVAASGYRGFAGLRDDGLSDAQLKEIISSLSR